MFTTIKRLLIGVTDDDAGAASAYGLSLASLTQASVTFRAASSQLTSSHADACAAIGGAVADGDRRLHDRLTLACARARLDAALSGVVCDASVPAVDYLNLVPAFVDQVRVHDLCVLDTARERLSPECALLEEVILHGGRPVIVVPGHARRCAVRRVVVGWDGSACAARAVADAMPFLRAAVDVEIVRVRRTGDDVPEGWNVDLGRWLDSHHVSVTIRDQQCRGTFGETLLSRAAESDADLIVIGAFNHSRLREWMIGGVTARLLGDSPVPVFVSH
ncbi:universal stress protein [soil metagenome]